jgi:hypothetical protein
MNGFLLPCAGEANPTVLPAPFDLGADITANNVVTAAFRNPPHQKHIARFGFSRCAWVGILNSISPSLAMLTVPEVSDQCGAWTPQHFSTSMRWTAMCSVTLQACFTKRERASNCMKPDVRADPADGLCRGLPHVVKSFRTSALNPAIRLLPPGCWRTSSPSRRRSRRQTWRQQSRCGTRTTAAADRRGTMASGVADTPAGTPMAGSPVGCCRMRLSAWST